MKNKLNAILSDYDEGSNPTKLPSRFQPNDYAYLTLTGNQYLHCKIVAVKFTCSKVLYDLDATIETLGETSTTRLHGVSSNGLISISDYHDRQGTESKNDHKNQIFAQAFTANDPPKKASDLVVSSNVSINTGDSDLVLIDLGGHRNQGDFIIGFYNFESKEWIDHEASEPIENTENLRWMYLPLAKYEK